MNWKLLEKILPVAVRAAQTIYEAVTEGVDNAEIRRRLAATDLILDEELDELRAAKDDLKTFVRTGR